MGTHQCSLELQIPVSHVPAAHGTHPTPLACVQVGVDRPSGVLTHAAPHLGAQVPSAAVVAGHPVVVQLHIVVAHLVKACWIPQNLGLALFIDVPGNSTVSRRPARPRAVACSPLLHLYSAIGLLKVVADKAISQTPLSFDSTDDLAFTKLQDLALMYITLGLTLCCRVTGRGDREVLTSPLALLDK